MVPIEQAQLSIVPLRIGRAVTLISTTGYASVAFANPRE